MTKYRHKNGTLYELKKFDEGYHLIIPIKSLDDFETFSKVAIGARMVPEGSTQANVIKFENVEEV